MNVQPEHNLGVEVNEPEEEEKAPTKKSTPVAPTPEPKASKPEEVSVPDGWAKVYTRDGQVRLVPEDKLDDALRDGMLPRPFDLDGALADFNAAMEDARVSVPKAIAESIATGYEREEDAWIISDCMTKVRDAFAALIFSAGALLPSEADIHAIREYLENAPSRAALKAEMDKLVAAGEPIPDGMEKNSAPSSYYEERAKKHASALNNVPDHKFQARTVRAESDRGERDQAVADALALRVRNLQIAGHKVELVDGVMHRGDEDGNLRPVDPNTGEFLPKGE